MVEKQTRHYHRQCEGDSFRLYYNAAFHCVIFPKAKLFNLASLNSTCLRAFGHISSIPAFQALCAGSFRHIVIACICSADQLICKVFSHNALPVVLIYQAHFMRHLARNVALF